MDKHTYQATRPDHHHQAQTGVRFLLCKSVALSWLSRAVSRWLNAEPRGGAPSALVVASRATDGGCGAGNGVPPLVRKGGHRARRPTGAVDSHQHQGGSGARAVRRPTGTEAAGSPAEPVTDGYVAAPAPLLAVPLLASAAGEAVDHSTLQFLLTHAIETKKALEEEEERMKRVHESVARFRAKVLAGEPLSAAEHEAWYGTSSSSAGKRRKKKRRKRKLPKALPPRCGRPCDLQRQVPAVQVVHVLEGAPAPCCATVCRRPT